MLLIQLFCKPSIVVETALKFDSRRAVFESVQQSEVPENSAKKQEGNKQEMRKHAQMISSLNFLHCDLMVMINVRASLHFGVKCSSTSDSANCVFASVR